MKYSVKVQALWRGRVCRRELAAQHAGAQAMQARWRGRQCRMEAAAQKRAATSVQCAMRGKWARRNVNGRRDAIANSAALILQRLSRCHLVRTGSDSKLKVIIEMQSIWRGKVWRREMAELGGAAIKLQAHWRGHAARVHAKREQKAALMVQANWRGSRVRNQIAWQRYAAAVVQRRWRGNSGRRRARREALAAVQVARIYDKYTMSVDVEDKGDSGGRRPRLLGRPELERISRDAHALGGRKCGIEMASWRLLCRQVASASASAEARSKPKGGLSESAFRWAVRPFGCENEDRLFEYDTCVADHAWESSEAGDLQFPAGAWIAVLSRVRPGGGWWTGRLLGSTEKGVFPANYVKDLGSNTGAVGGETEEEAVSAEAATTPPTVATDADSAGAKVTVTGQGLQGRKLGYGGSSSMMPMSSKKMYGGSASMMTLGGGPISGGRGATGNKVTVQLSSVGGKKRAKESQKEALVALASTVPEVATAHDLGLLHRTLFLMELKREAAVVIQAHWRGFVLRTFVLPYDWVARKLQATFRARFVAKRKREHSAAVQIQAALRGWQGRLDAAKLKKMRALAAMSAGLAVQQAAVQKSTRKAAKREKLKQQKEATSRMHVGVVGEEKRVAIRWLDQENHRPGTDGSGAAPLSESRSRLADGRQRWAGGGGGGGGGKGKKEDEESSLLSHYG